MGAVMLVENFFDTSQFPNHVITADESAADAERVADWRRSGLSVWNPPTTNVNRYLQCQCDRVRAFNGVAIDIHNLEGHTVELRTSFDGFTTYKTVFSVQIPTVSAPGPLTNGLGIVLEGDKKTWWMGFEKEVAKEIQLYVPAMGAGLSPSIGNAAVGMLFRPHLLTRPHSPHEADLFGTETTSDYGVSGRSELTPIRSSVSHLQGNSAMNYGIARYHLQDLFGAGYTMLFAADEDKAQEGVVAHSRLGKVKLEFKESGWSHWQTDIDWVEVR